MATTAKIPDWDKDVSVQDSVPAWDMPESQVPAPSVSLLKESARQGLPKKEREPASIGGEKEPSKSRKDFGMFELSAATGLGAGAGALLPQILGWGGTAASGLPGVLGKAGMFAQRAAPLVGGTASSRAFSGALSGAASETAGQVYEMVDEPGFGAEATRFAVGGLPVSSATAFATGKAGRFLKFATNEKFDISKANKAVIEQKNKAIEALRGEGAGYENYQRLFDQIKSSVDTDIGLLNIKAAQIATQAEDFAKALIKESEQAALATTQKGVAAAADISARAQKSASDIASQFEQKLAQFKMTTEADAQAALQKATNTAQEIRNAAAGKAKDQRQKMYQEAADIEQNTQNQVQEFLRTSQAEVTRLRSLLSRTGKRMEQSRGYVQDAAKRIGEPLTETEIGQIARAPTETQFNNFKKIRKNQIGGAEDKIFKVAKDIELQGSGYQTTKAYSNAIQSLEALLVSPETQRASITVPQLENQIKNVLKALKGKEKLSTNDAGEQVVTLIPGDFQSLEYLRRFLADRAAGVPAEGFDAIGQKLAGELKNVVQGIQDEFVAKGAKTKPWTEYLEAYRAASIPINNYKSQLGEKLLGKTEWDASQYAADAADIPKSIFKSIGSVDSFRQLSGASDADIEKLGRQFVANELFNQGVAADKVSRFEWLKFPPFAQLKSNIDALAKAEQLSGTTAKDLLGKVKERGAKALKTALRTEEPIQDILTKGAVAREKAIPPQRKEIEKTIEEGKKTAIQVLGVGQKDVKSLLGQIPIQERKLGAEVRQQQKQIGREAAKEAAGVVKEAGESAKGILADAKQRAADAIKQAVQTRAIPEAEANALQSELNKLTETPKKAFEKIAFGVDPVGQLRKFAPYITRTKQGIEDYQRGLMDGLASKVNGNPDALVKEWNDILGPAHVQAGLISQKASNSVAQQLDQIQQISAGKPEKLNAMKRIVVNLIRNSVYQGPAFIARRLEE
jgi:hypothetical protein